MRREIMKVDTRYFEYLSLSHLDPTQEKLSENFIACKNTSILPSTNRVFIQNRITENDIQQLKQFYGNVPFTLWVDKNNIRGNEDAELLKFEKRAFYPLMLANLQPMSYPENPAIKIAQITSKDSITNFWSDLVSTAYNISPDEFRKFVTYLTSVRKFNDIRFYVGYFDNLPAATSMVIQRENLVDIHWVGTLPEFRNKGLGQAVTVFPLNEIKKIIKTAILYASAMGKPLYEKIGFSEVGECYVWIRNE
jgi:ribosomal protein S18 acetylase RimI-like enzyme